MGANHWRQQAFLALAMTAVTCAEGAQCADAAAINEIRVDQLVGGFGEDDPEEYIELIGYPGESLDNLTYIVIGDGTVEQGSGVIEAIIPLSGSIGPSGLFVIAQPTFMLGKADLIVSNDVMNFEDNDNVTHRLVKNFIGFLGQDLDTNDDGVMNPPPFPWSTTLDSIALIKSLQSSGGPPVGTEHVYTFETIGPDPPGSAVAPCYVFRGDVCYVWQIGQADLAEAQDSPGQANVYCKPNPPEMILGLPHTIAGAMFWYYTSYGTYIFDFGPLGNLLVHLIEDQTHLTPGWQTRIDIGTMGAIVAGSQYTYAMVDDGAALATLTISEIADGNAALTLTQSLCETCALTVEVVNNGEVVASDTFLPPYPQTLVQGAFGSAQYNHMVVATASAQELSAGELLTIINGDIAAFAINGQATAEGTAVRFRLNDVPQSMPRHDGIRLAANLLAPQLYVQSEELLANAVLHSSFSSMIAGDDSDNDGECDIVCRNGSFEGIPYDGLGMWLSRPDIDLDGFADLSSEFRATIKIGDDGQIDEDSNFNLRMVAWSPIAVGGAGSLKLVGSPGQPHAIRATFPAIGATLHTTEILHHGEIVYSNSGLAGDLVAHVPPDAVLCDVAALVVPVAAGLDAPQLSFKFESQGEGIPFALPDQSVQLGDEVRVTADNPTVTQESVCAMEMEGWGLPGGVLTIIDDAYIMFDLCPADIAPWSGNGVVDVDDLLLVINNWGDHGSNPADIALNGVVDVDDLLAVINAWGECE